MPPLQVTVDCSAATCVEFPGRVRHVDNAVQMMGGTAAVTQGITQAHPTLTCRPRAKDHYSHPLFSSTASRHRLLLKITRGNDTPGQPAAIEAVARLTTTHRFRGLADFQVVSGTAQPLDRSVPAVPSANQAHAAEPNRLEAPMLLVPPLFASGDGTAPYGFQGYARKESLGTMTWTPKAKQPLIAWDAAAPDALFPDSSEMVKMRTDHPMLLATLQRLFAERPVWLLPALLEHPNVKASDSKPAIVETAIAMLSYRFSAGPWRPALICRGQDPRKDSQFWRFQVLSVTLPDHWKGSAAHHRLDAMAGSKHSPWKFGDQAHDAPPQHDIASQYCELMQLGSIPATKVSYYQVCDITDQALLQQLCGNDTDAADRTAAQAASADAKETLADADAELAMDNVMDPGALEPQLTDMVSDQSGWLPLKLWQKCSSMLSAKVLSLLPDGTVAADAGRGAYARQTASPALLHAKNVHASGDEAAASQPPSRRLGGLHSGNTKTGGPTSFHSNSAHQANEAIEAMDCLEFFTSAGEQASEKQAASDGYGDGVANAQQEAVTAWSTVFASISDRLAKTPAV